jgi:hypothetical protein
LLKHYFKVKKITLVILKILWIVNISLFAAVK